MVESMCVNQGGPRELGLGQRRAALSSPRKGDLKTFITNLLFSFSRKIHKAARSTQEKAALGFKRKVIQCEGQVH